jgi:hypothetical protein
MKQTFLIRAHHSNVRIDERFIADRYSAYLYASEGDFSVISFNSKKEMREAFAKIARPSGETFYIDNENGAAYVKVINKEGRTDCAFWKHFVYNFLNPHRS